jgi:hypothetical protein
LRSIDGIGARRVGLVGVGAVVSAAFLAGCGGGSSHSAASGTASTTQAAAVTTVAPWAATLGAGVSLTQPGSKPPPGTTSPGGVVEAEVADVNSGHLAQACALFEPSVQATCMHVVAGHGSTGATFKAFGLGYIAIKGTEALVGSVGTSCNPGQTPACSTNTDPAALFSSGQSFDALYAAAVAAMGNSSTNVYALAPCVQVGSGWYLYIPASDL